jgi:hypothetical protein
MIISAEAGGGEDSAIPNLPANFRISFHSNYTVKHYVVGNGTSFVLSPKYDLIKATPKVFGSS